MNHQNHDSAIVSKTVTKYFLILLMAVLVPVLALPSVMAQEPVGEGADAAAPHLILPPQEGITPDIIGGQQASKGEWPWQVALISAGSNPYYGQFCGGSLIAAKWVLTAAHCVEGKPAGGLQILAGIQNLASPDAGYQRLNVQRIIVHPNYNNSTYNNDIALIELKTAAVLGSTAGGQQVATVPLVAPNVGTLAGQNAWVTGWGNTSSSGVNWPDNLMEVRVPIVTNADCNDSNSYNGGITSNMLCAGLAQGGKDSCQGDSGGPLVVGSPNFKLAGIVSWGSGCALPNLFGVYTRVSNYITWINKYVDLDGEEPPPAGKPTITSFSPTSGSVGTKVTITGTNLTGTTRVRIGGKNAAFSVLSNTSIEATVAAGAVTGKVIVISPEGRATSTTNFTVVVAKPPKITSFSPNRGTPGTRVVISGQNLAQTSEVTFNGTSAVIVQKKYNQVIVRVPAGATTGKIVVATPGGTATHWRNFIVR